MPNITVGDSHDINNIHAGLHFTSDGPAGTAQLYVAIPLDVLEDQIRVVKANHDGSETGSKLYFYSPPMERWEVNRFIKALRRARDRIFGRDE